MESSQGLQVQVLIQKSQGDLLAQNKKTHEAIESYQKAFNIFKAHSNETDFTKADQLLTGENIESVHRALIKLNPQDKEVEASLTKHLYAQLKYFLNAKNWEAADRETDRLMLNIAKREEQGFFGVDGINTFSCLDLKRIDQLWFNADNRFGFSVQKQIWIDTKNRLGIKSEDWNEQDEENYLRFVKAVGWYVGFNKAEQLKGLVLHSELIKRIKNNSVSYRGSLPTQGILPTPTNMRFGFRDYFSQFYSRVVTCKT
nr:GUN4 domain-containing protein [Nostoc flagelliforme]